MITPEEVVAMTDLTGDEVAAVAEHDLETGILAASTVDALQTAIATALDAVLPHECADCFRPAPGADVEVEPWRTPLDGVSSRSDLPGCARYRPQLIASAPPDSDRIEAWAAARRAIGTRNGEQDT